MFVFCALNEIFFIALYLLSFSSPLLSPHLIKSAEDTGASVQQGAQVNNSILRQIFPDPFSPAALEMARANKMDSFWPWTIAAISVSVMVGKQIINVVQLINASQWLAEVDRKNRRAQGLPRKVKAA